jgi:hypothetical protein
MKRSACGSKAPADADSVKVVIARVNNSISITIAAARIIQRWLLDNGKAFPTATSIDQLQKKRSYRNWTWAVVDVDASELGDKAARINITLPQRVLRAIDAHARKQGETRSGFLARAALNAMRRPI